MRREVGPAGPGGIEKAAHPLHVLGFLEEERGEVHRLLESPLAGHHVDEGEDVHGDGLLAPLKERRQPQQEVLLVWTQPHPILPVAAEVDVGRIPDAEALGLVPEAERGAGPVEAGGAGGGEGW